jgi:hypothetical protein
MLVNMSHPETQEWGFDILVGNQPKDRCRQEREICVYVEGTDMKHGTERTWTLVLKTMYASPE